MSQNIDVKFRVSGSELSAYMDGIKKKGQELADATIKQSTEQTNSAKEQLRIAKELVIAKERQAKVEIESARSILAEKRAGALKGVAQDFDQRRENVFSDKNLSEDQKKETIESLYAQEKGALDDLNKQFREELKVLREQEKQQKASSILAGEQLRYTKDTSKEQVKAIKDGTKTFDEVKAKLSDGTERDKLALRTIQEQLEFDKRKDQKEKDKEKGGPSFLGSLLTVDNFNRMASGVTQAVQTQNGFDAIQSTASTAGRIIGGLVGGLIGGIATGGTGAIMGAGVGASILGEVMGDAGAIKQRQAMLTQDFLKTKNRFSAITGISGNQQSSIADMTAVGIDANTYLKQQTEFARRRGFSSGSDKTTKDAIFAEKGFGVDQGTSALLIEMQRSSRENNRDLAALIGGVWEKGAGKIFKDGDRTFLNEFLGKFTTLQKELLKTQGEVATGTTMDILTRFDSIGGQFSAKDPRSMGLLQQLNNSLMNPDTDFKKSLTYYALRRAMPNAGIADIIQEQQKGVSSETLMESMFSIYGSSGDEDSRRLAFASLFGGNVDAGTKAYRAWKDGKLKKGEGFGTELQSFGADTTMQKEAETNTAMIERLMAENLNKVLAGSPLQAAIDSISDALESAFSDAVIQINSRDGVIILKGNESVIKQNAARTAQQEQRKKTERVLNSRDGIPFN